MSAPSYPDSGTITQRAAVLGGARPTAPATGSETQRAVEGRIKRVQEIRQTGRDHPVVTKIALEQAQAKAILDPAKVVEAFGNHQIPYMGTLLDNIHQKIQKDPNVQNKGLDQAVGIFIGEIATEDDYKLVIQQYGRQLGFSIPDINERVALIKQDLPPSFETDMIAADPTLKPEDIEFSLRVQALGEVLLERKLEHNIKIGWQEEARSAAKKAAQNRGLDTTDAKTAAEIEKHAEQIYNDALQREIDPRLSIQHDIREAQHKITPDAEAQIPTALDKGLGKVMRELIETGKTIHYLSEKVEIIKLTGDGLIAKRSQIESDIRQLQALLANPKGDVDVKDIQALIAEKVGQRGTFLAEEERRHAAELSAPQGASDQEKRDIVEADRARRQNIVENDLAKANTKWKDEFLKHKDTFADANLHELLTALAQYPKDPTILRDITRKEIVRGFFRKRRKDLLELLEILVMLGISTFVGEVGEGR